MPEISRKISLDAGIEQILTQQGPAAPKLPDAELLPGSVGYQQQLSSVLFPPSVEQALVDSFRPEVHNRAMLTPVGFSDALKATMSDLREAANQEISATDKHKLQDAMNLLEEDRGLRDLLGTYRQILHRA